MILKLPFLENKKIEIKGIEHDYTGEVDADGKATGYGSVVQSIQDYGKASTSGTFSGDLFHGICE